MSVNSATENTQNPHFHPPSIPPSKRTPTQIFFSNIFVNVILAAITAPSEGLAVRRILSHFEYSKKRQSYFSVIKKIGLRGLFQGALIRISYCLSGNYATLQGIYYLGSDPQSLGLIALGKNGLLPLSLLCNARQNGLSLRESFHFVTRGFRDPVVHCSFFTRNLLANSCLIPGFFIRDRLYSASGETDTRLPTAAGYTVSVIVSTTMNVILKPFFTGQNNVKSKCMAALRFTGFWAILLREAASLGLVFSNTSPHKKL